MILSSVNIAKEHCYQLLMPLALSTVFLGYVLYIMNYIWSLFYLSIHFIHWIYLLYVKIHWNKKLHRKSKWYFNLILSYIWKSKFYWLLSEFIHLFMSKKYCYHANSKKTIRLHKYHASRSYQNPQACIVASWLKLT